jgi:predicted alpha-1,2-mannosidase
MIDPVLADGAKRGIYTSEELEIILEAMLKHANIPSEYDVFGRTGCEDYVRLGYVPSNYHESVNLTLDAAYGDWCIAQIATILGKNDIAEEYYRRAKSYRNIFDKESGFMRAKDSDGAFRSNFSPERWGLDYTEASAYQTSFAVQHDIEGLCELHGGRDALIKKLDEFFDTKPIYLIGGYGREIHEMSEMAAADFGQCAISNQPSFHIPFIYAYLGMPEKTEFWIEKLCREAFSYRDDGFPGDEDNGTTAAWFMMATMGFYPLTPGKNEFIRFKPLLDNVRINGKTVDELLER